ncbi:unnamed protein product [Pleuronectes platessa]|uniref:Uncharacterized protein n=1 Tax=Pleuronectes platessa TaxID=8262 RepID=A0A9N7VDQ3_PLEPL|nr:unnamed protein product [Pleuronectes platessa]
MLPVTAGEMSQWRPGSEAEGAGCDCGSPPGPWEATRCVRALDEMRRAPPLAGPPGTHHSLSSLSPSLSLSLDAVNNGTCTASLRLHGCVIRGRRCRWKLDPRCATPRRAGRRCHPRQEGEAESCLTEEDEQRDGERWRRHLEIEEEEEEEEEEEKEEEEGEQLTSRRHLLNESSSETSC